MGCGPSGSCNTKEENTTVASKKFMITVERGPLFLGEIVDAKGVKANNTNLGFSNIYQFTEKPFYPISAKGGYIDINRDGNIDTNDAKLDITMSSYFPIISPITTLIGNNPNLIDYLSLYYPITKKEIVEKVPSKSSINAVILSNTIYLTLKLGYSIGSEDFNRTIQEVGDIYKEKFKDIQDLEKLSYLLEVEFIKNLLLDSEVTTIEENLSNVNNSSDLTNSYFVKDATVEESISDIWDFTFELPNTQSKINFDLGIHLVQNGTQILGNMVVRNIQIEEKKILSIGSLDIFGSKPSGATGSVSYISKHDMTQNSIALVQGKYLLFKLGYIMENQTIVSKKNFTKVNDYTLDIYFKNIDIGAKEILEDYPLRLNVEENYIFPKGTQKISGLLHIKRK